MTVEFIEVKPTQCCGEDPLFWPPSPFDRDNMERIECMKCGRVIYGSDDEYIAEWNNGDSDG